MKKFFTQSTPMSTILNRTSPITCTSIFGSTKRSIVLVHRLSQLKLGAQQTPRRCQLHQHPQLRLTLNIWVARRLARLQQQAVQPARRQVPQLRRQLVRQQPVRQQLLRQQLLRPRQLRQRLKLQLLQPLVRLLVQRRLQPQLLQLLPQLPRQLRLAPRLAQQQVLQVLPR